MTRPLVLSALMVIATMTGSSVQKITQCQICNPSDYTAKLDLAISLVGGYEMGLEGAVLDPDGGKNVLFAQAYGNSNKQGTFYVNKYHQFITYMYDMNAMSSYMILDNRDQKTSSCEYSKITVKSALSYMHKNKNIILPDGFLDTKNLMFKSATPSLVDYRGVDAKMYEACILDPATQITYGVTYYFSDGTWNMESGLSGPTPIGMEICSKLSTGISTSTVSMVNFHNHLNAPAGSAAYHAFFTPPSNRYCPTDGSAAKKPSLTTRYSFSGEYALDYNKTASPIAAAYDSDFDMMRYDFLAGLDDEAGSHGFQTSWVVDGRSAVKYNINLINGQCDSYSLNDNTVIKNNAGALALIGKDRLSDTVLGKLNFVGVKPCRRMACDFFTMVDTDNMRYEYSFLSHTWAEQNAGSVNISRHNILASVARVPPGYGDMSTLNTEGVEVFGYTNDKYKLWQFEIASLCYFQAAKPGASKQPFAHRFIRLYFKGDHRSLDAEKNAYLRAAIIETAAKVTGTTPMRISGLTFDVFRDQMNVEFIVWDAHYLTPLLRRISLNTAVAALKNTVQAGKFTVPVGPESGPWYSITADSQTFDECSSRCSELVPSDTKLKYTDGYSMGMQIAIDIPPLPDLILNEIHKYIPDIPAPFNTTYYIEAYHGFADGENGGHGALHVYDRHTRHLVIYNEHALESVLVRGDLSCEVSNMNIDYNLFPFGYMHNGSINIPIPQPDILLDLSRFQTNNIRERGSSWTHGFLTTVFEANIDIGELAGQTLPFRLPLTLRWYWLDRNFENEDGSYKTVGPIPAAMSAEVVIPKIPLVYGGGIASAYITVVNYHNHYPDMYATFHHSVDPARQLLEVPAGVYCKPRIHEMAAYSKIPALPPIPKRFRVKTETVVRMPYHYVINSEDFMDYESDLFRFDVTEHHAQREGQIAIVQYIIEPKKDTYYKIDHSAPGPNKCTSGKVSASLSDIPPLRHALLAPYELFNFDNLNEEYQGVKPCRDMTCHYWIGKRALQSPAGHTGTYEIWSSTIRWDSAVDKNDNKSTTFVKITATIKDDKTGDIWLREEMELYDMQLMTPKDLAEFKAPEAAYCVLPGEAPNKPSVDQTYTYRGEYVALDKKLVQTFRVMNDGLNKIFRYDAAPSKAAGETSAFRSTWLLDIDANLVFQVDRVTDTCGVSDNQLQEAGQIWDLIYPETLRLGVGDYVGPRACRSKFCETFVKVTEKNTRGYWDLETYFTGNEWFEYNSDYPLYVETNVLSRIAKNSFDKDGVVITSTHTSVDVFGYTKDVSRESDFHWIAPCFAEAKKQYFRLSVVDENGKGEQLPDTNEYFRTQFISAISMIMEIKPYRIISARFKKYDDEIRVSIGIAERYKDDSVGTSLDKAVQQLNGVLNQLIPLQIPDLSTIDPEPVPVQIRTLTSCGEGACDIDADRPIIFQFDAATAFGVFFGCFIGGCVLALVGLGFWYSRRLRVSVKDVYLMKSPSAPSNVAPVSLSGLSYP